MHSGLDGDGAVISQGNFTVPIPLRNTNNPADSYILTQGRDPSNISSISWMMFPFKGTSSAGYRASSGENESFNYSTVYNVFDSTFTPAGIFNNGTKDYIVLLKAGVYSFYTFTGTGTFLTPSTLTVTGGFYGNTLFDGGDDIRVEKNKNSGIFFAGKDTNGNGIKEFVVTSGGFFRFYEITDAGVVLLKEFGPYSSLIGAIKWGYTEDNNMYGVTYNTTSNAINYYKTNTASGAMNFVLTTDDNFYSGGGISDLLISRLGTGSTRYNKVMIENVGMFDVRAATPSITPLKLSNDFYHSYDMDNDGNNEVFIGTKAYTFNSPGNYTLKYDSTGFLDDLNGDGIADSGYSYCKMIGSTPYIYFSIRSGANNSEIVPEIDWGNGNGYCAAGGIYSVLTEDFNKDGTPEIIAGVGARGARIISLSGGIVSQGNSINTYAEQLGLAAFDFDGDGVREIIRGSNNAGVMKGSSTTPTLLSTLVDMPGNVKPAFNLNGGLQSFYKLNNTTYVAYRGADGQVALKSWNNGVVTNHFNYYFLNAKRYVNYLDVIGDGNVPIPTADVLLGDFIGNGGVQVLVGGGDGYIYIISTNGSILKALNIGSSIRRIIVGDTNEDNRLDVLFSADDGYVYQLGSSRIDQPLIIKDGLTSVDISEQPEKNQASLNYLESASSSGYLVQLYNKTHKSVVFDWIDVGNVLSACISSKDTTIEGCTKANKNFSLSNNAVYQWKVQSYNTEITSPISFSNGFIIK